MPLHRLDLIYKNPEFFRKNYKNLMWVAFVFIGIIFILISIIIYKHLNRPIPPYFVTTTDGKLIEIKPLSK